MHDISLIQYLFTYKERAPSDLVKNDQQESQKCTFDPEHIFDVELEPC